MFKCARSSGVFLLLVVLIGFPLVIRLVAVGGPRAAPEREAREKSAERYDRPEPEKERVFRDYWVTPPDGPEGGTYQDVTIPFGFFGPECDGFEGRVHFVGSPLDPGTTGNADTVLERSADPVSARDAEGTTGTVTLRLTELSLVSKDPIAVECDDGLSLWHVHVGLSSEAPWAGWMTATKAHEDGGTFDSMIYVQPLLTFTNVDDPGDVLVFDMADVSDPAELAAAEIPFVLRVEASIARDDLDSVSGENVPSEFIPGIESPTDSQRIMDDPDYRGPWPRQVRPRTPPVVHQAPGHQHCVEPTGACCHSNGSCSLTTAANCDGEYLGEGTSCGYVRACCFDTDCEMFDNVCCPVYGGSVPGAADCGPPNPCGEVSDTFPSTATIIVRIDPDLVETVVLSSVGLSDTVVNRTAPPYADGVDIETEIVNLELAGSSPILGEVFVRARTDRASTGGICNVQAPGGEFGSGDSYFNVFIEVDVPQYGLVLDTGTNPVFLEAEYITELPPFDYGYVPPPSGGGVCEQPGGPQEIPLYDVDSGALLGAILHTRHDVESCLVKIEECRDLCVDGEFTFSATGTPAGGTYSWSVSQPGNQLTPPSGTGQTFPVTASEPSQTMGDVTVTVTYTAPGGRSCQDVCQLTVLKADLDIIKPDGNELEEAVEDTEGEVVNVNIDDDDNDGGAGGHAETNIVSDKDDSDGVQGENDLIRLKIHKVQPDTTEGTYKIEYSDSKIAIWKNADKTDKVTSNETTFPVDQDTEVYVEGLESHGNTTGDLIKLVYQKGDMNCDDKVKMIVASMMFALFGDGGAGKATLTTYLNTNKKDQRTDPFIVAGKDQGGNDVYYSANIYEDEKHAKITIGASGSYIVFDGHSNFGIGPAFSTGHDSLSAFMNVASARTGINWPYLRSHGHPDLAIQDGEIPQNPANYTVPVLDMVRFPNNDGVDAGEQFTLQGTGLGRFHYHYGEENLKALIVEAGSADMPTKRYKVFFMSSCFSGLYYIETFNYGVFFYTTACASSSQTTKVFIEEVIAGKTWPQIKAALNAIENLNDFHDFNP